MAHQLKSYVEKFLLNPAASFNVDDEGNKETTAQIVESLADDEGVVGQQQPRSKLRARSEALLQETDSRYRGKKVSRKDLKKDVSFDPELTKFFAFESDGEGEDEAKESKQTSGRKRKSLVMETENGLDDEEEEENDDEEEENNDDEEEEEEEDDDDDEDEEVEDEDDEGEAEDGDQEDESIDEGRMKNDGLVFDGDFSKFAEDIEEGSDDDEDDDEEDDEGEEEEEEAAEKMEITEKSKKGPGVSIKKFLAGDEEEEIQKSQCVKKQLALFDSLFEMRIGMQKGVAGANQLPQFNTYKSFLKEKDANYMKNLASAKSAAKKLLSTLLEAQMLLLNQNPETSRLIKPTAVESDEEITSGEDETEKVKNDVSQKKGTKRKLKLEEYGDVLSKRHAALLPFRDETLTRWYEKTKLLSSGRGRDKFSGFEVSALQQLNNLLNNKPQLIRRTQLTGITRGTTYHVLGSNDENVAEAEKEEYDPELFDDNDFYSRALEDMLKSKISLSDDMSDVSRKWIEIQKLRKKAKRKVDTKASKGRKLRYEVISKLQQYLAPCGPPQMDDSAINTLFGSLFGKGIQGVKFGSG